MVQNLNTMKQIMKFKSINKTRIKNYFFKRKINWNKNFFNGNSNYQSNYSPTNINGLTGCLTFFDLKLYNVTIEAVGSSCEDTVNFINVTGEVEK